MITTAISNLVGWGKGATNAEANLNSVAEQGSKESFEVVLYKGHDISKALNALEGAYIEFALGQNKYNQSKTAKALGISRGGLRIKLKQYFDDKYV